MKTSILGCLISNIGSYNNAYNDLLFNISKKEPNYITVNNVHTIIEGVKNNYYRKIINNALIALPDGKPLSVVAKLKGEKNIARIFGPSFMEYCLDKGREDNLKHYFFGSSREVLEKMIGIINFKYPGVKITGSYSPPYKSFTIEENKQFMDGINNAQPDIVWVGLGAPKQELWMADNYAYLKCGIMIGIGAGFDYLAGNLKHAPAWMKNYSLEWLYRLLQEPERLWKRYLVTNSLFIFYVILELTGLKKFD